MSLTGSHQIACTLFMLVAMGVSQKKAAPRRLVWSARRSRAWEPDVVYVEQPRSVFYTDKPREVCSTFNGSTTSVCMRRHPQQPESSWSHTERSCGPPKRAYAQH
jgi:hypothetical protein